MKRRIAGLSQAALPIAEVADGLYLVRVESVQYRWDKQKPHYALWFAVVEPRQLAGTSLSGRFYCTEKALWKLSSRGGPYIIVSYTARRNAIAIRVTSLRSRRVIDVNADFLQPLAPELELELLAHRHASALQAPSIASL